MRHLRSALFLVGVALLSAYFMTSAYQRAKHDAITQLYAQERILANQAAEGVAEYFDYYHQVLDFLSKNTDVVESNERGQRLLRDLFASHAGDLLSLTRVGADGHILYSFPEERAAGRYILDQPHVRTAFETRQPVVSQVFMSVQGFESVALHVPVFDDGRFAGSLAALIPFAAVSKRHVEGLRIGASGYALLLSREGIELYCPVPGHTGQSIRSTMAGFPAALAMAERMLGGETGEAVYAFDHIGGQKADIVEKHAYFAKIPLENTFWSILVTAPEAEALVFIQGFRDRWAIGMALLLIAFGVWGVFLGRAYVRLHREETSRAAQERVQAAERERERVLRESEERFRRYFEDSLVAMAIVSPAKSWIVVNERLTHLLGYADEELRALTWEQVAHPDDLDKDLQEFNRMLAGDIDGYSIESRFLRKDRGVVHTILSMRLVRTADGTPEHCLAQLQDITERKQLDEERAKLGEQLRLAQKLEAVGQLAGGAAHDYNNLLTVQLGHLGLLQLEPGLSADVRESLTEIEKSATMAAQLTRQLLAFSRRQVLQVQRMDLNETVESLSKMLRRVLREDITLTLALAPGPLWLDADRGMMEQVIMNLVVNARDAMPAGGRLTLSTSAIVLSAGSLPPNADARTGRFVCLTVADSGKGMDAETQGRIFEPFFTTKEVGEGTGLGLATVYGIVRQHNGWIDVDSAPGAGAVFRVYYRASAPDATEASRGAPSLITPSLSGSGETILVAEDNPAVRQMLVSSLERLHYRVVAAADAAEAMRLWDVHRAQVCLLLTDMVMVEGVSGLELARTIRRAQPQLPVIVMSGYSRELVSGRLDADMVFMAKPWTAEVLARTVRQCLTT